MKIQEIIQDKNLKPKEKTELLSKLIMDGHVGADDLVIYATEAKDPVKATCIEALEFASSKTPSVITPSCIEFVTGSLMSKAPRVKWESAKVIGNVAHIFKGKLEEAVKNLLVNTEHPGTVVRWSAAYALSRVLVSETGLQKELAPALKAVCDREEKNSIRKIYEKALKECK